MSFRLIFSMASIPEKLEQEVQFYCHRQVCISASDVTSIVKAVDYTSADGREAMSLRLGARSIVILCGLFKRAEDCLAQQRGLCLLTVRLPSKLS